MYKGRRKKYNEVLHRRSLTKKNLHIAYKGTIYFSKKLLLLRLSSQHRGGKTENYFKNPENDNSYLEKKLPLNTPQIGGDY